MKFILLFVLLLGCVQTYNSHTNDAQLFGTVEIDRSSPSASRFADAYEVIEKKCINCHTTKRHSHWAGYTAENDWYTTEGGQVLVEANDPESSALIYRLKTWGEVGGMPDGPDQLTEEEYIILRDWILNIGN